MDPELIHPGPIPIYDGGKMPLTKEVYQGMCDDKKRRDEELAAGNTNSAGLAERPGGEPSPIADLQQPPQMPSAASLYPSSQEVAMFRTLANAYAKGAFGLGKCRSPEAFFTKMMIGREHGLPHFVSISEIDIIEGKAAFPARLKVAIIRQRGLGDIRIVESTDTRAVVEAWRADEPDKKFIFEDTIEKAQKRGTLSKSNWKNYPRNMLIHSVDSQAALILFPELFAGIAYTPDELGANTDEAGRVVWDAEFSTVTPAGFKKPANNNSDDTPKDALPPAAAPSGQTATDRAGDSAQSGRDGNGSLATKDQLGRAKELVKSLGLARIDWETILGKLNYVKLSQAPQHIARTVLEFLAHLDGIRKLRAKLGMTDAQWTKVLDKRGVTSDLHLSHDQAKKIFHGLCSKATPFQLQTLGLTPADTTSTAGNESPPAKSAAA